jgi:hypothetical protein
MGLAKKSGGSLKKASGGSVGTNSFASIEQIAYNDEGGYGPYDDSSGGSASDNDDIDSDSDDDEYYSSDDDDVVDDDAVFNDSSSLQDILEKELFGKKKCLTVPSRAAKEGYGTLSVVKKFANTKRVSSWGELNAAEALTSFKNFEMRKSASMEFIIQDGFMTIPRRKNNGAAAATASSTKPDEFLQKLLSEKGAWYKSYRASELENFFVTQNYSDYNNDIAWAVRKGDLKGLKDHVRSGRSPQCCNRHTESIIHTICRKGHKDLLEYLLEETDASLRICCDQQRTVLHDAAWSHQPDFDMIELIIRRCPDLLYIQDNRGHTPLNYVAAPHWDDWCKFLAGIQDYLAPVLLK